MLLHSGLAVLATLLLASTVSASAIEKRLPESWESIAGLGEAELKAWGKKYGHLIVGAQPPPRVVTAEESRSHQVDTGAHKYVAPKATDQRGKI